MGPPKPNAIFQEVLKVKWDTELSGTLAKWDRLALPCRRKEISGKWDFRDRDHLVGA